MSANGFTKRPLAAFEFENPGRADLILSWSRLEEITQLDGTDREKLLEALAQLASHLDDPFLEVETRQLSDARPRLLTLFECRAGKASEVGYAVVTLNGRIHVGHAERLRDSEPVALDLDDFDPKVDELTSIATTDTRLVGNRLDLWIGVRRQPVEGTAEDGVYHALVWLDEKGKLNVAAAKDDNDSRLCERHTADRFPAWFCKRRLQQEPVDLSLDLPEPIEKKLDVLSRGGEISLLLWRLNQDTPPRWVGPGGELLVGALDERTFVLQADGKDLLPERWSRERIKALAMPWEITNNKPAMILALHAHSLLGLDWSDDAGTWGLERRWAKRVPFLPTTLKFYPPLAGKPEDLLVVDGDGLLHRLRMVEVGFVRQVWESCWKKLSAENFSAKASLEPPLPQGQRRAWLLGVTASALEEVPGATPAALGLMLEKFQQLFLRSESDYALLPSVQVLLQELERLETNNWGRLENGDYFIPSLLFWLYDNCAPVMVRSFVDSLMRELQEKLNAQASSSVAVLFERSKLTHRYWWSRKPEVGAQHAVSWVSYGFERWGSAAILAASLRRLPLKGHNDVCTAIQPGWPAEEGAEASVYLAGSEEIGRLIITCETFKTSPGDPIRTPAIREPILYLGSRPNLLAVDRSGQLHFLSESYEMKKQFNILPNRNDLRAWAFNILPTRGGRQLAASVLGRGLESILVMGELDGDDYRQKSASSLAIRRVRAMALAEEKSSTVVALGSSLPGSIEILKIDSNGQTFRRFEPCHIKAGVSCLAFDRLTEPRYLFCGDRAGFVWCIELGEEDAQVRWIFRAKSMIRAFCALTLDDEERILIGSEDGDLSLLDSRTGRRLWKSQLHAPIQALAVAGPMVVTLMRGGMLTLHELLSQKIREQAWERATDLLRELADTSSHDLRWDHNDADSAGVFRRLFQDGPNPKIGAVESALESAKTRAGRARLLRWLAVKAGPELDRAALLPKLRYRELALLIAYLPDEDSRLDAAIDQELKNRGFSENLPVRGDNSLRSRESAWVYWVQRRSRQNLRLKEIVIGGLDGRWLRLELARLLWVQARRTKLLGNPQLELLFMVLRWPPDLLVELEEIVPREDFSGFLRWLAVLRRCLVQDEIPSIDAIVALGELERRARPLAGQRGEKAAFFFTELSLFLILAWQPDRSKFVANLNNTAGWLAQMAADYESLLQRLSEASAELDSFFAELSWLPKYPLAPATETVPKRLAAVEHSLRSFEKKLDYQGGRLEPQASWMVLGQRLQLWLWQALHKWLQVEHHFLLELIRPRLTLLGATLNDSRLLRLSLRAEPDGLRQLQDVSLLFSLGDTWSQKPEPVIIHFSSYYTGRPAHDFFLEGYLRHELRKVDVEVEMAAADGYRFEEKWTFPVQEALHSRKVLPVATALPQTFRSFVQEVWSGKAGILVVEIDESLGRAELLRELEQRKAILFDLDGWLREYGPGRKYAERALDLSLWREAFTEARQRVLDSPGSALVLGPTSETLSRWLDFQQEDIFAEWWRELRETKGLPGRLLVIVSSRHGALLQKIGLNGAEARSLRRWPFQSRESSDLLRELKQHLEKYTKLGPEWVEELGGDLRLIEETLLATAKQGRTPATPRELFSEPETRALMQQQLARLDPLVLVAVVLGALAESLISFSEVMSGQVSAAGSFSIAKIGHQKQLVMPGDRLTPEILFRLSANKPHPVQLNVEGVSLTGIVACKLSRLDRLFQSEPWSRRAEAIKSAEELGFGRLVGKVYRTEAPWRTWIRQVYEEQPASPRRDTQAFQQLLGKRRHPTELLDGRSVLNMDLEALGLVIPEASRQDLQDLRQFAHLYLGQDGDPANWLRKVFASARVDELSTIEEDECRPLKGVRAPAWRIRFADGSETFYFWIRQDGGEAKLRVAQALADVRSKRQRRQLRLALIGPGLAGIPADEERRLGILQLADVIGAAWDGNLGQSLENRLRAQLSLTAYSPFQLQAALPPGSTLFVGRDKEQDFIRQRIRLSSFLILGARRIGKTSLMNAIFSWAKQQTDLFPLQLDLQGMKSGEELRRGLKESYGRLLVNQTTSQIARDLALLARSQGKLAVFFLNEIDGIATLDRGALEMLRALNDEGLARFVMTGYYIVVHLGDPKEALFHFSSGPQMGGKAMVLSVLEEAAARRLLGKLQDRQLGLAWASPEDQKAGEDLLLERSYRVPWALQQYAHNLIEHMEKERRVRIRLDDVEQVLAGVKGRVVWDYIDSLDYQKLMPPKAGGIETPAFSEAFRLLLYAIARIRYFLGGRYAAVRDERLRYRNPAEFGFTTAEAIEALNKTLQQLVKPQEFETLRAYFLAFDFDQALRLLTLTLALEPDPAQNGRWMFSLHIVPRELERVRRANDPTLDAFVVDLTSDLITRITQAQTRKEGMDG